MQIQIHLDRNSHGDSEQNEQITSIVTHSLNRFSEHLTRVDVFVHDENSHKDRGDDKKCVLEARPAGRTPVAVTHLAGTVIEAVNAAAEKMESMLDRTYGKKHHHKGHTSIGGDQEI